MTPSNTSGAQRPGGHSRSAWLLTLESAALAVAPFAVIVGGIIAGVLVAVAVLVVRPETALDLWASVAGDSPKIYWYLSRAASFVSFGLITTSMLLGLAITNKIARAWPGGPTYVALHEHTALLGLLVGGLHAVVLLGDRYIGYTLVQLMVPFASGAYRPFWVGLGQLALWLLTPVTLSFYVRRFIGQRAWRLIHFLNFAVFGLTLVHGLFSGSDTGLIVVRLAYWGAVVAVAGLTSFRILAALAKRLDQRPAERAQA